MTSYHTTVLDREGLLRLFQRVAGRRLIGAVDGFDCVELVFEDPDSAGQNLVTIYTDQHERGQVLLGFVSQELIDAGYGQEEPPA